MYVCVCMYVRVLERFSVQLAPSPRRAIVFCLNILELGMHVFVCVCKLLPQRFSMPKQLLLKKWVYCKCFILTRSEIRCSSNTRLFPNGHGHGHGHRVSKQFFSIWDWFPFWENSIFSLRETRILIVIWCEVYCSFSYSYYGELSSIKFSLVLCLLRQRAKSLKTTETVYHIVNF